MEIYKNNVTLEDILAAQEEATKKHFPINGDAYTLFLMGVYVEKVGESNEEDIDDTFNKCTTYLNEFLHSKFNDTNKSLVECINEYMDWRLEENKKEAYKNKLLSIDDKISMLQLEATCKNNELKDKRKEIDGKYQVKYEKIRKFLLSIMEETKKINRVCKEVKIELPAFEVGLGTYKIKFLGPSEAEDYSIGYYRLSHNRYVWENWLHFGYDKMVLDSYGNMEKIIKDWRDEYKVIITEALEKYVEDGCKTINDCLAIRKSNMMDEERALEGGEF